MRILHNENLTNNKNFGYQAFNDHSADKLIVAYIFEIWGQWCHFRDIGQNIQILVKNKVYFIKTYLIYINFFQKVLCKNSVKIALEFYLNHFSNIPIA